MSLEKSVHHLPDGGDGDDDGSDDGSRGCGDNVVVGGGANDGKDGKDSGGVDDGGGN